MIRFINLGRQYWADEETPELFCKHFAFLNTVTNHFMQFNGSEIWDCLTDFEEDYKTETGCLVGIKRYTEKIDKEFVR